MTLYSPFCSSDCGPTPQEIWTPGDHAIVFERQIPSLVVEVKLRKYTTGNRRMCQRALESSTPKVHARNGRMAYFLAE